MELTRKVMTGSVVEKADGRPLVALVSRPNADLVGDVIKSLPNERGNGWQVDDFNKRGGRINWMHDVFRPNLAKAKARPSEEGLLLEVTFDLKDAFAAEIDRKYREGYLDEWSVGFYGVKDKMEPNDDGGFTFFEAKLSEVSAVNAGMHPETATLAKSFEQIGQRLAAVEAAILHHDDDDGSSAKALELLDEINRLRAALVGEQRS